jgi:hypothetical protein
MTKAEGKPFEPRNYKITTAQTRLYTPSEKVLNEFRGAY